MKICKRFLNTFLLFITIDILFISRTNKIETLKIKSPYFLYIVISKADNNGVVLTSLVFNDILKISLPYGDIKAEIPVFATLTKGMPNSTALILANARC